MRPFLWALYFILKNIVLSRDAGSLMGHACPVLRESETIGYASRFIRQE